MVIIKKESLEKLMPIVWYGMYIYKKDSQIKSLLNELLGDEFKNFLLTPRENSSTIEWICEKQLQPYNLFSENEQNIILNKVTEKTSKIIEIANKLKLSNEPSEKESGELLSLSVEFPDLSFIFADNDLNVFIAGWGFQWRDGASDSHQGRVLMKLSQYKNNIKSNNKNNNIDEVGKTDKSRKKSVSLLPFLLIALFLISIIVWCIYSGCNSGNRPPSDMNPRDNNQSQPNQNPKDNNQSQPNLNPKDNNQSQPNLNPKDNNQSRPDVKEILKKAKFKPIKKDSIKQIDNLPGKPKVVIDRAVIILKDNVQFDDFVNKLKIIKNINIISKFKVLNTIEVEILSEDEVNKIKSFDEVLSINFDNIFKKNSSVIPFNDPLLRDKNSSWHLRAVNAFEAWSITKGNPKTVIAVIDGSFDINHPEFEDKTILVPYNASLGVHRIIGVNRKHGTHVSSLAVASIDNSFGSAGLCPNCSLMPIELAIPDIKGFSSMSVVRGVIYAIDNGADVINLSLGKDYGIDFSTFSQEDKVEIRNDIIKTTSDYKILYDRLYKYAKSKNVIIVYASGNDDMFVDIDPAKRDNDIVLVSATNMRGEKANFSNFGENVNISAPGVKVVGAVPNGKFKPLSGTSMATPIVSGIIGLMKTVYPNINIEQIKDILKKTSKRVVFPEGEKVGGLIDAKKALEMVKKLSNTDTDDTSSTQIGEIMKMDKNVKDASFSYGLWRSDTPLYNKRTGDPIVFYYNLEKNNSYRIIEEKVENGKRCKGSINLSFKDRILYIKAEKAICNSSKNSYYVSSDIVCKADEKNIVLCSSKEKDGEKTVYFKLIRESKENK